MPESALLCAVALLLIAATTHRFRRDAGLADARVRTVLRVAGTLLMAGALVHCGTALPGERIVRLLGCASIGGALVVVLLSAAPRLVLAPIRLVAGAAARRSRAVGPR